MGYRGAWNIIYKGVLYLYVSDSQCMCDPRDEEDALTDYVDALLHNPSTFAHSENIRPFPLALHNGFSCVNTLDIDNLTLKAKTWVEIPRPKSDGYNGGFDIVGTIIINITFFDIQNDLPDLHITRVTDQRDNGGEIRDPLCHIPAAIVSNFHSVALDEELANLHRFTPLELFREQLMLDIINEWRTFFNDHDAWSSSWTLYQTLCEALLRVAAWDFEIHDDRPLGFESFNSPVRCPMWNIHSADIFWFHRILIVLCSDASDEHERTCALGKAAAFLKGATAKVILFSLPSIVVVSMSPSNIQCSRPFRLLRARSNTNFNHSLGALFRPITDGLRVLPQIFSSVGWRATKWPETQTYNYQLPIELWENIYQYMDTRTRRKFAQAAPLFEHIYYSRIPELRGVRILKLPVEDWGLYTRYSIIVKNGLKGKLAFAPRKRDPVSFAIYLGGAFSSLAYMTRFDA